MSICNIIDDFKNNKYFLLCDIKVSDEDYYALIRHTQNRINKFDTSIPPRDDVLISITLVQIAIREYKEGNYWGYFDKLFTNVTPSKKKYINQLFINTLKNNDLFIAENLYDDRNQYVENIKAHSFVPNNYLNGYFDFLYSFYEGNLLRNIPDDLSEDLYSLQQFMRQSLSSSGDIIKLENLGIKKAKTYKLLKATRRLFSSATISNLEVILLEHLRMLDNFYYDGIKPPITDRFSESFNNWILDFENEYFGRERNKSLRKRGLVSHKPYFKLNNEKIYIVIPQQKFRDNEFLDKVELYINGSNICDLEVFNSFGIKVSEEKSILCTNIFNDYNIQIFSLNSRAYSIPKSNYRIFNENWESITTPKRGINYLLLSKGQQISSNKKEIISTPFSKRKEWDIYQIEFDDESKLYINDDVICLNKKFTGKTDTEQFSSRKYFIENAIGERIYTFYKHIMISFVVTRVNFARTILHCNNQKFANLNIPGTTKTFEIDGKSDLIGVEINLDNLLVREDGEYLIWIDEPNKPNREIIRYLLVTDLWCKSEYYLYYFQKSAKIITNGNYSLTPINCKFTDEDNEYNFTFKDGFKVAKFNISVADKFYVVNVPLNTVEYNINGKWQIERPEYIWIKNLPNLIYIRFPGALSCNIFVKSYPERRIEGRLINGIYEFDITELKEYILSLGDDRQTLMIEYEYSKLNTKTLFNILKTLEFHKFSFYNNDGHFCINAEFVGDAKCYVNIKSQFSKEVLANNIEISKGENIIQNIPIDEVYEIERICVEEDKFGFGYTELSKDTYKNIFVGELDFEKSYLNIVCAFNNGKKLEFDCWYSIKNIKAYQDMYYIGTLYESQKSTSKNFKPRVFSEKVIFKVSESRDDNIIMQFETDDEPSLPCYDNKKHRIVSEEMIKDSVDYDRYFPLFDDETVFVIKVRRFQ